MNIAPKTRPGKWSVGLIIVFFLLLGLFWLLRASGQRGGETFFSNPILAVPALGMVAAGILSFFTGIAGIIKEKERSVLVFLSTAMGLFILLLTLGEVLFPH